MHDSSGHEAAVRMHGQQAPPTASDYLCITLQAMEPFELWKMSSRFHRKNCMRVKIAIESALVPSPVQ